jgi:hydrogenase nickel incorporation protein HypA/HybF
VSAVHEEALIRDLLGKIDEVARAHGAERVRSLTVWVGALSHLTEDQFRSRFGQAAVGTAADGADIRIRRSDDLSDPRAQGVVLESVVVDTGELEGSLTSGALDR